MHSLNEPLSLHEDQGHGYDNEDGRCNDVNNFSLENTKKLRFQEIDINAYHNPAQEEIVLIDRLHPVTEHNHQTETSYYLRCLCFFLCCIFFAPILFQSVSMNMIFANNIISNALGKIPPVIDDWHKEIENTPEYDKSFSAPSYSYGGAFLYCDFAATAIVC